MQLQTTSPESKIPNEYSDVMFIQIDQHLEKLLQKYKGVPIFWITVYSTVQLVPNSKKPSLSRRTRTNNTCSNTTDPSETYIFPAVPTLTIAKC